MNTITKFILLSILTFLFLMTGVMIGKEVQAETIDIFSILIYFVAGVIILLGVITLFLEKTYFIERKAAIRAYIYIA